MKFCLFLKNNFVKIITQSRFFFLPNLCFSLKKRAGFLNFTKDEKIPMPTVPTHIILQKAFLKQQ
jgi:hypothetical protein